MKPLFFKCFLKCKTEIGSFLRSKHTLKRLDFYRDLLALFLGGSVFRKDYKQEGLRCCVVIDWTTIRANLKKKFVNHVTYGIKACKNVPQWPRALRNTLFLRVCIAEYAFDQK